MNRDKVIGMFLGVGIGDALGMPVEVYKRARIIEQFGGRVDHYHPPAGHQFFDGKAAGDTTDDTQLTLAVAEALIEADGFDMDAIARHHVRCLDEDVGGWGSTTRGAIERLKAGVSWKASGVTDQPTRGRGNGVCMKVAPLAAYFLARQVPHEQAVAMVAELAGMTHRTGVALSGGLAHVSACGTCLRTTDPHHFETETFIERVVMASESGQAYRQDTQADAHELTQRLKQLAQHREYDVERTIAAFGGGSYYVMDSLPFSYMFFCRNPHSIETLYEVVSAGGDTDSNGSMMASLLGALHGTSIFPEHLIEGLKPKDKIVEVANRFCDCFEIA
jgi:ADP-ribosyl-[dinitrogen reductase] hydrolase